MDVRENLNSKDFICKRINGNNIHPFLFQFFKGCISKLFWVSRNPNYCNRFCCNKFLNLSKWP